MEGKRTWRNVFLWIMVIFAIVYSLPTLIGRDSLPKWFAGDSEGKGGIFSKKLNFGLDLQGGLQLRYKVDWQEATKQSVRKIADGIRTQVVKLKAEGDNKNFDDLDKADWTKYSAFVEIVSDENTDYNAVLVKFKDQKTADQIDKKFISEQLDERFEYYSMPGGAAKSGPVFKLLLPDEEAYKIRTQVVSETKDTIGRRIEAFGLVDPDIRAAGDDYIVVQIPGVGKSQMDTVRQRIGQTAQLTLRIVDTANTWLASQDKQLRDFRLKNPERAMDIVLVSNSAGHNAPGSTYLGPYVRSSKKSELIHFINTLKLPTNRLMGFEKVEVRQKGQAPESFWRTQLLEARADITGDHLAQARVSYDEKGPYVSLDFDSEGGRIFANLTEKNVENYMAIMLDEDINSSPQIQEKIGGGRARITLGGGGSNSRQVLTDTQGLVKMLNHGAYKAPVYKVMDTEVGPSLGADSVAAGKYALLVGMLLVICFMILIYRGSGLVAVTVLTLNMLFILVLLISLNAALTLPGMAGIILTIGMAVDANIIIFERIREELRAGRKPMAAIDAGYEKAFSTIVDANITTALAGAILFLGTSGPIHGFAVTLLLGIVCSVFTAVYMSRRIFNWWLESRRPEKLSI
jgi:preprotein translocase subunit SecD